MRITIFHKGLLLISLPLLCQFLFIALVYQANKDAAEANRLSTHSKHVLLLTGDVLLSAADAQSSARAVVINPVKVYADDFASARDRCLKHSDDLWALVSDNPSQQAAERRAHESLVGLMGWLATQSEAAMRGRIDDAAGQVRAGRGRELMAEAQQRMSVFSDAEERLDAERTAAVARARRSLAIVLLASAIVSTGIAAIAVAVFGKSIASRIATMTSNAVRLAEGQPLDPPLAAGDEIGVLDRAMHATAVRLRTAAGAEKAYQREIERRAEELAKTNEDLRQQTQENEMFVYSVSHDLRSPLVNLQGFSRELGHSGDELRALAEDGRVPGDVRQRLLAILRDDMGSSVKFIQTAVSRSSAIIDALLRLSRAGRVEYKSAEVDVAHIARRVVDAMRGTIDAKGAEVVLYDLAPAEGDATAIEQIFGNLIGNAVNYLDASRPGRVEVGMVESGALNAAGRRTYYVRDNGLGIPAAYLGKVFVAFQRLHGDVAKGEGIGLALVRRIVERHGGRVAVESAVGVGTTFYVELPAVAALSSPPVAAGVGSGDAMIPSPDAPK